MPTTLNVAMPLGTLDGPANTSGPAPGKSTQDAGTFTLLPEGGRRPVTPGDYITIANHDPRVPASARFRGRITEVSGPTCAFVLQASRVDPYWPPHIHPMGQGNAVYLALPGSFIPNPSRSVQNQAEWDMLLQLAADHQERTGIPPSGDIITLSPPHLQDENQDEDQDQCP